MGNLSEHFSAHEFACKCGRCQYSTDPQMDPHLIEALEWLRAWLGGHPLMINSGRRCLAHNAAIGGEIRSQHLAGKAADIPPPQGWTPETMRDAARELDSFHGLGLYNTFVHLDVRDGTRIEWDKRTH